MNSILHSVAVLTRGFSRFALLNRNRMSAASPAFVAKVDGILAWIDAHSGQEPSQHSQDPCEKSIHTACRDLRDRARGPIRGGKKPSDRQLTASEVAYFSKVEELQNRWASQGVQAASHVGAPCSVGICRKSAINHVSSSSGLPPSGTGRVTGRSTHATSADVQETPSGKRTPQKSPPPAVSGMSPNAVNIE